MSDPRSPTGLDHRALARELLTRKPVLYEKLHRACDVDRDGAVTALVEVLRFLSLCARGDAPLTPSPRVDDAWHELVLCTREYQQLCREHFGRFVHHDPAETAGDHPADNRRQFRETLRRYRLAFGTPDPAFWGPPGADDPTADCGGCETL